MSRIFSSRLDRVLLLLALLYLYLPNLLFVLGWVRLWAAIPLAVMLTAAFVLVFGRCRTDDAVSGEKARCAWLPALAALALALVLTEAIGLNGHVWQHNDFEWRNPIYETLCRESWPIYGSTGDYFVYYHAFLLPAAALSKLLAAPTAFLYGWCALGFWVVLMLLHARLGWRAYGFVVLLFLLGHPLELLAYSHHPLLDQLAGVASDAFGCSGDGGLLLLRKWTGALPAAVNVRYVSCLSQCDGTFNHGIPLLLFLTLTVTRRLTLPGLVAVSAWMATCSPLGSMAVAVLLLLLLCRERGSFVACLRAPAVWLCVPPLATAALYFTGVSSGTCHFLWQEMSGDWGPRGVFCITRIRMGGYVLMVVSMLLPLLFVVKKEAWGSPWLQTFCVLTIVLPLLWVGDIYNELLFKGSFVMFFAGAWMLFRYGSTKGVLRKILLVLLLIPNVTILRGTPWRKMCSYSWDSQKMAENRQDALGGHLNHPKHVFYPHFFGKNPCPALLCDRPGELPRR